MRATARYETPFPLKRALNNERDCGSWTTRGTLMAGVIVHEWISKTGGSEKVLDAMVRSFPSASVQCLWNDVPSVRYPRTTVSETWMAKTPLRKSKVAALAFMPATRRLSVPKNADWILASSHVFAHHIRAPANEPEIRKFSYVYTPARYIWNPELDGRGAGWLPRLAAPGLRSLDRRRAQESYEIAAISEFVRDRIKLSWNREARVIYPPVETTLIQSVPKWSDLLGDAERLVLDSLPREFVLGASRYIPYKRLDLVINIGEASGLPVVLAGSGPEESNLRRQARGATVPVQFVSRPSDKLLYALYEAATIFAFPAVEDFGIMPVEAMALGTPVIVRSIGGSSETVRDGVTGSHLAENPQPIDFQKAVARAASCLPSDCRAQSRRFSETVFDRALTGWLGE